MNNNVTYVFKPIGMGPKDCIEKLKNDPKYKNMTLAFASRLDPMAYGIMPIIHHLDGTERDKCQSSFNDSFKVYKFNVILGLQTDTFDILGIGKRHDNYFKNQEQLIDCIKNLSKITEQAYPIYSSKTVYSKKHNKMVPLWQLAKEKELPEELPKHTVNIKYFELLSTNIINGKDLLELITERINTLPIDANFRQKEILENWNNILNSNDNYTVLQCEANVSSGTYIRGLANDIGGICYDIFRTQIKDKNLNNHIYNKYLFSII